MMDPIGRVSSPGSGERDARGAGSARRSRRDAAAQNRAGRRIASCCSEGLLGAGLIAVYRDWRPLRLPAAPGRRAGMAKGISRRPPRISVLLTGGYRDRSGLADARPNAIEAARCGHEEILQTLGLRAFGRVVVACPGCGRTSSTFFRSSPRKSSATCASRCRSGARPLSGVETMQVAVMAAWSTPGESKHRTSASRCPGPTRRRSRRLRRRPSARSTLKGERIAEEFQAIVDDYVRRRYRRTPSTPCRRRGG